LHENGGQEGFSLSSDSSLEGTLSSTEKTIVSNLGLTVVVDEDSGGSNISVNDVLRLEVLETSGSRVNDVPKLRLRESSLLFDRNG
jgi:hypothetical protein